MQTTKIGDKRIGKIGKNNFIQGRVTKIRMELQSKRIKTIYWINGIKVKSIVQE